MMCGRCNPRPEVLDGEATRDRGSMIIRHPTHPFFSLVSLGQVGGSFGRSIFFGVATHRLFSVKDRRSIVHFVQPIPETVTFPSQGLGIGKAYSYYVSY